MDRFIPISRPSITEKKSLTEPKQYVQPGSRPWENILMNLKEILRHSVMQNSASHHERTVAIQLALEASGIKAETK